MFKFASDEVSVNVLHKAAGDVVDYWNKVAFGPPGPEQVAAMRAQGARVNQMNRANAGQSALKTIAPPPPPPPAAGVGLKTSAFRPGQGANSTGAPTQVNQTAGLLGKNISGAAAGRTQQAMRGGLDSAYNRPAPATPIAMR